MWIRRLGAGLFIASALLPAACIGKPAVAPPPAGMKACECRACNSALLCAGRTRVKVDPKRPTLCADDMQRCWQHHWNVPTAASCDGAEEAGQCCPADV